MIAGWLLLAAWSGAMFALGAAVGMWWVGRRLRQVRLGMERGGSHDKDATRS